MKNVIFITIDSLIYDKIGSTKYGPSPTPFLDKLKEECIWCSNMYSQGPYTEAGNKALMTGDYTLNNGGYTHNLNESDNIYLDVFKDAGYETYDFILPYYLYSSRLLNKIDHQFFTSGYVTSSVTVNRLDYFAGKKKNSGLTEWDYLDIFKQIDPTFACWKNFLEYQDMEKYTCIRQICQNFDFSKAREKLEFQELEYLKDKKAFADRLLDDITKHPILEIANNNYSDLVNESFIKENVFKRHSGFLKELKRKQLYFGLKNGIYSKKEIIKSLFNCITNFKFSGYFKYFVFSLFGSNEVEGYTKKKFYQLQPSCRTFTRKLLEEFKKTNDGRPRFFHLHPEELHNRFNYFSYDINDASLIDQEFDIFQKYLSGLKSNYQGQILYDISLLYVDDCLKELFDGLKNSNLINNTILVVAADHGSFYNCTPVRHEFKNTCHTENYHIPVMIFDGEKPKKKVIESYHTSADVLPTIYELCQLRKPSNISGISLLDDNNNPSFAITEYMGNGCPDMRVKPINFIIRDENYMVQYFVHTFEPFETGKIERIYDLKNDPLELHNLSEDENYCRKVSYLLEKLNKRQLDIRTSYLKKYPGYIYAS